MSTEAAAQTKPTKLSGKDLKDAIKRQVEFYFSRANLANDAFLVSQMNSQMFVPVETIVGFGKIKQLTSNPSLVVEAIQDSKVVVLNETKDAIKPNIKSERNTIILREIPSATKPEDVEAIFEGCEGEISVRSDVGDTWFVTLASEDAAVKTLLELRNKTFHGAPIKARLKSENVLKSFFPAQTVVEPVATGGAYSRGYYAAGGNGYYDVAANYGPQYASGPRGQYAQGNGAARGRQQQPRQQNGAGRGANGAKEGRAKSNSFDQQQPRPASRKAKDKKNKAAAADKQTPAGAKKGAAAASAAAPASAERQPVLNSANFPPLPASDKPAGSPYGEIKFSYAHEDILEIVKHMDDDDCKLPSGKMDFEAHAVALTPVAHPDLLRNQRTYSIEQAREALRQGRPIRSDSIGSIDYESMMYGEDYTKEARELRKQKAEAAPPAAATGAAPAAATPSAAAAAPAQPKVVGYAAALIYGTPAPQPPVEAKKKAAPAATAAAAAPATAPAAAGAKGKAAKGAKGDEKKAPKKKEQQPVVDETLPKAGAWGGRAFAEVVKSEPVNPPPAPAKAPAPTAATATSASPSATAKTAERKNSDGKWERNQKDRRPVGGDKQ